MRSLTEIIIETLQQSFVFEGTFGDRAKYNWDHVTLGKQDYALMTIDKLISGEPVKFITKKGGKQEYILDTANSLKIFDKKKLEDLKNSINAGKETDHEQFNDCVKNEDDKLIYRWQNIDKTFIRGKGNKGIAFEKMYADTFEANLKADLMAFLQSGPGSVDYMKLKTSVESVGGQNNSRKLKLGQFTNNDETNPQNEVKVKDILVVDPSMGDGKSLSDVTVHIFDADNKPVKDITGENEIYLSLKSGPTVCFLSCGIRNKDGITADMCKNVDYDKLNDSNYLNSNTLFGSVGNKLCETLGINDKLLAVSLNNIDSKENSITSDEFIQLCKIAHPKSSIAVKGNYIEVNLKGDNDNFDSSWILNLLREFIGCRYVMVHQDNKGHLEYYDFRERSMVDDLLGNDIASIVVRYPAEGKVKRAEVDIKVNDNLSCKFVLRDKQTGTAYPTHIMCDYKLSKTFQADRNQKINKIKNEAILKSQKDLS